MKFWHPPLSCLWCYEILTILVSTVAARLATSSVVNLFSDDNHEHVYF